MNEVPPVLMFNKALEHAELVNRTPRETALVILFIGVLALAWFLNAIWKKRS